VVVNAARGGCRAFRWDSNGRAPSYPVGNRLGPWGWPESSPTNQLTPQVGPLLPFPPLTRVARSPRRNNRVPPVRSKIRRIGGMFFGVRPSAPSNPRRPTLDIFFRVGLLPCSCRKALVGRISLPALLSSARRRAFLTSARGPPSIGLNDVPSRTQSFAKPRARKVDAPSDFSFHRGLRNSRNRSVTGPAGAQFFRFLETPWKHRIEPCWLSTQPRRRLTLNLPGSRWLAYSTSTGAFFFLKKSTQNRRAPGDL